MSAANYRTWMSLTLVLCCLSILSNCGTLPNGRGWGQDATLTPGWDRIGKAALGAALEPGTWLPAAGALVFQIDGFDRRVSNWATKKTPIFGSQNNASGASEYLQGAADGAALITLLATPSGEQPKDWFMAKLKGLGITLFAVCLNQGLTDSIKYTVRRTRPNNTDRVSFPSGHASTASACNTLASRNIDCLSLPAGANIGLKIGLITLTAAEDWSKVEAKEHFPADVLLGTAIGHFVGAFINDAFMGTDCPNLTLRLNPSGKDLQVAALWQF